MSSKKGESMSESALAPLARGCDLTSFVIEVRAVLLLALAPTSLFQTLTGGITCNPIANYSLFAIARNQTMTFDLLVTARAQLRPFSSWSRQWGRW